MSTGSRAFVALDRGSATLSASLVGLVDGGWRLLGSLAAPSSVPPEAILEVLAERLATADPDLARALGAGSGDRDRAAAVRAVLDWPRLEVATRRPPRLVAVGASERTVEAVVGVARRAGWDATGASVAAVDALSMSRLLLRSDITTVVAAAADPAAGDERGALPEIAALVAAAAARRPELTVVLAGPLADHEAQLTTAVTGESGSGAGSERATIVVAPAPNAGDPSGEPLRAFLDALAAGDGVGASSDDGRRATVRSVATLAVVLDRTIEAIDVGRSAGLRVVAEPSGAGEPPSVRWSVHPLGGLVPTVISDEVVDGVLAWSVVALDRHRMRDRLRELRDAPWGEAHGDGALLRLAAARAAVTRLVAATRDIEPRRSPDLVLAAGGAWAVAPGPAIALALSDVLRRPGASQLAFDHARLLGPLGTIEREDERRAVVADLADDLLAPLGGVVVPAGLRPGRSAGRLVVHASGGSTELDLVPGGLELVDLPPGESAVAELQFRDQVSLGTRGRRFALELAGGLGGLLVDLRDVPLRLPDRLERRRELLGAWQQSLWAGIDE